MSRAQPQGFVARAEIIQSRKIPLMGPSIGMMLILLVMSCREPESGSDSTAREGSGHSPWFEEVAGICGLDFVHQSGAAGEFLMPEIMTTGVALFDADNDGDLDAYLVQGGAVKPTSEPRPGNQLYLNDGSGMFTNVSSQSGAEDQGYGMAVATGDYDGDGDVDLYVSNLGRNTLLRNEGGGLFSDLTQAAGVAGEYWSASAAFVDPDGDGDLDLFVTNYLHWSPESEIACYTEPVGRTYCSPKSYNASAPDEYFENQGDGTFKDVSESMGLRQAYGNGLGIACADFDGDGIPEIFVANDGTPNQYWNLTEEGVFQDTALIAGCAVDDYGVSKAGMGVAIGDIDSDGDEDLLVVNLTGETDSLYRNDAGHFVDRTPSLGLSLLSRKRTRFGVSWQDFDRDGLLDLYQANGRVSDPRESKHPDPYAEENLLLRGVEGGRFEEVLPRGGVMESLAATSRAAAFGDIDLDGDVDILISNRDAPVHLLRNLTKPKGHWASLEVVNEQGAPALGAQLFIELEGRTLKREVRTAESYGAANSPWIHLGLGTATEIRSIKVIWPRGGGDRFGPLSANEHHTLRPLSSAMGIRDGFNGKESHR